MVSFYDKGEIGDLRELRKKIQLRRQGTPFQDRIWAPALEAAFRYPMGDPAEAESLIEFLEEDPYFFRSGYLKQTAIRRLKKFDLSADQRMRVEQICLRMVDGAGRLEFRDYCRLALFFGNPDFLIPALVERLSWESPWVRQRAVKMLSRWPMVTLAPFLKPETLEICRATALSVGYHESRYFGVQGEYRYRRPE